MIKKVLKAGIGIILYAFYAKKFKLKLLKDKTIAVVGPADSALHTGLGTVIDNYDIVVRFNKAPYQLNEGMHKEDIGSRLDILFHNFLENEKTGGGRLDFELYKKLGIAYVVNPIPTYFGRRLVYNFYKKYLIKENIYIAEKSAYEDNIEKFGKYRPTTGFAGLNFILNSDFRSLHITGFTFFKTAYGDGYRDHLKNPEINKKHIKTENAHDPDIEYNQFVELLKLKSDKEITTDKKLSEILMKESMVDLPILKK